MKTNLLAVIFLFCAMCAKGQWVNQNAGFTNKTLGFYEMSIVDSNNVWAICYDGVGGLFGPAHILDFTRTMDGGTTWIPGVMGSDSTLAFSSICALSDTEAWVSMHKFDFSGGGGLFHTIDGGINWIQSNPGVVFDNNSFPNFVHFKDVLNGVAGGDMNGGYFEIYTTTDGGNNWTRTPQANVPAFIPGGGYGWFDGYAVLGDTVWFGTNGGQMYKSTDFGLTWTVSTVDPVGRTVYEIAFNDDGLHGLTHVRSNTSTILFATSDGGSSWTQLPTHPKWKQSKITSVPGTNTFVSTSVINSNRGSAYTNDNGLTWTEIESATPKAACRFYNSNIGWAGGFFNDNPAYTLSGGIYKWDSVLTVTVNEVFDQNSVIIYPNPASALLNISISEKHTIENLQIFDIVGSLVKEVSIKNSLLINIEDLPNGIYILRSKHDNRINVKFIKTN